MIPSAFMFLNTLPLTPTGKIDRRALPEPEIIALDQATDFVAPRNLTEEIIAKIWAEILELQQIGIHENFFDSGGHSLLAMQLISKLSKALNQTISVKNLFLYPTIAKLSETIEKTLRKPETPGPEPLSTLQETERKVSEEKSSTPLFRFECRPLFSLFVMKKLAPCDSAVIDYPTTTLLQSTGLHRDDMLHNWLNNLATMVNATETHWGRIASLMLPLTDTELFCEKETLISHIVDALELAKLLGTRVVTLTGLLGFATDYGRDVVQAIAGRKDLPEISTGHAAINSAYVLNIEKILQEGKRNLSQERVAFVDLGSLGAGALRLMLGCLPHPEEILLCDMHNRGHVLQNIRRELTENSTFKGKIRIVTFTSNVPSEVYEATLFVSAFNIPGLLDITKVTPGTLIVGPACFGKDRIISRFEEQQDILFTFGGGLRLPYPVDDLAYLPRSMEKYLTSAQLENFHSKTSPYDIPGCAFSSLLASCFEELKPTIGIVDEKTALTHYKFLRQSGCQGVALHVGDYVLPETTIQTFCSRFGRS